MGRLRRLRFPAEIGLEMLPCLLHNAADEVSPVGQQVMARAIEFPTRIDIRTYPLGDDNKRVPGAKGKDHLEHYTWEYVLDRWVLCPEEQIAALEAQVRTGEWVEVRRSTHP
jgi:hypothetical protein